MVDLSKPLTADHCREYFRRDYSVALNSYYTRTHTIPGIWFGKEAEAFGLSGPIQQQHFERLTRGRDPFTNVPLLDDSAQTIGKRRACWDMTFNAPKGVSLTGIVGDDTRVLQAHRESVYAALSNVAEHYIQARMGNVKPPITTERFAVAIFHHDTSRPVDGYPAPHLHSHCVIFNVTRDETGKYRALQERELYRIQSLIDAEYQSQLGQRLRSFGYQTEASTNHSIDVKGYSKEYLDAESPRTQAIHEKMEEIGATGRHATSIVAHGTRSQKLDLTPEALATMHQEHATQYGNQPHKIVAEAALDRVQSQDFSSNCAKAVNFARDKQFERTQVAEHWELVRDAMRYRPGTYTVETIEQEVGRRVHAGELRETSHVRPYAPGARYKTLEGELAERDILQRVVDGKSAVRPIAEVVDLSTYPILRDNQKRQQIIAGVLTSTDQILGIQGSAGTGKTTLLGVIADEARQHGWRVQALAPTGKSADSLARSLASVGVSSNTIQSFNQRTGQQASGKTLYFLDEASLASLRDVQKFLFRVGPRDHVLLIGDDSPFRAVGQHTSVEAGRIFRQCQEAGMPTAQLNKIVRQKDFGLKQVVMALRDADPDRALSLMEKQGRIQEAPHRARRYEAMAKDYADSPYNTLIVSPDNKSLREINRQARTELQQRGLVKADAYIGRALSSKDVTRAEARRAAAYNPGDVIRYVRGDKKYTIQAKSYAEVLSSDREANQITVRTSDNRTITYDPSRGRQFVSLYVPREQPFASGDRIQFTAKYRVAKTRDSGYIQHVDETGNANILLDKGNRIRANLGQCQHIDYAYAMTSHSAQSMTVDRVLIHAESDSKLANLINREFANVAGSRSQYDLRLYTDDKSQLRGMFSRSHEKHMALSREENREYAMATA